MAFELTRIIFAYRNYQRAALRTKKILFRDDWIIHRLELANKKSHVIMVPPVVTFYRTYIRR